MRNHSLFTLFFIVFILTSFGLVAQNGVRGMDIQNISDWKEDTLLSKESTYIIGLESTPQDKLQKIKESGVEVLKSFGALSYEIAVPSNYPLAKLKSLGVVRLSDLKTNWKIASYVDSYNTNPVSITFNKKINKDQIQGLLEKYGFKSKERPMMNGRTFVGEISHENLVSLASEKEVDFIDLANGEDIPLIYETKAAQANNVLSAAIKGGRNLHGEGVVVGVGDGGELGAHLDFNGRVVNFASGTYSSYGDHGDHVAGIIGAGGMVNERHKGVASKSTLLIQKTSRIITYADTYHKENGMVLTSNSYGSSSSCDNGGEYNYTSQNLDWQLRELPEVLHVYAAGNNGGLACTGYPAGYNTVMRSYASAKNVLTVGAVDEFKNITAYSSRGPAKDGRVKPEITAVAENIYSTNRNYGYRKGNGTSTATPAVAGTIATLIERYRQLNGGANPRGDLMKAIVCNTAEDRGNVGVDYQYGFGVVNAKRGLETVENAQYFLGSIREKLTKTHTVEVNTALEELKVMLYWHDLEAQPYPAQALVNDLDIEIVAPDGSVILPWVLDENSSNVAQPATRRADKLNNIEQITITNPQVGTYTIRVKGVSLPLSSSSSQDYVVTFDKIQRELTLTHPYGAEVFEPGTTEMIVWEATDKDGGTFNVEYRKDGGAWNTISQGVAASVSYTTWAIPAELVSSNIEIRVTQSGNNLSSTHSVPVRIIPRPSVSTAALCDTRIKLDWTGLEYASRYEIFQFNGFDYDLIGNTTSNTFTVENNLLSNTEYWFAVRAYDINGAASLRSIAVRETTNTAICDTGLDLSLEEIIVRKQGRENSPSALTSKENVSITIKNNSVSNVENINVSYRLEGGVVVTEQVELIAANSELNYSFKTSVDLSKAIFYSLDAWVSAEKDSYTANDSIKGLEIEHIPNPVIQLPMSLPYANLPEGKYYESDLAVADNGMVGFENVVNGGMDVQTDTDGQKVVSVFSVDAKSYSENALIFTFNLSNYPENKLLLNFEYYNATEAGINTGEEGKNVNDYGIEILARGSEYDDWVSVTRLLYETDWVSVDALDVISKVVSTGQSISSTYQLKFKQVASRSFYMKGFTLSDGGALPVELSAFAADKLNETDVELTWTTATELNNDYFEIQVANGQNSLENNNFVTIGEVNGVGTSAETQNYRFVHSEKYRLGTYYYRLKQFDFDGGYTYSEVVAADFDNVAAVNVYPNPIKHNRFFIDLENQQSGKAMVEFIALDGRIVNHFGFETTRGSQTIGMDLPGSLVNGIYLIRVSKGDTVQTKKVILKR